MERRDFLRLLGTSTPFLPLLLSGGCSHISHFLNHICESCSSSSKHQNQDKHQIPKHQKHGHHTHDKTIKSTYFEQDFPDDIYFLGEKFQILTNLSHKFALVSQYVGAGNFNLLGFDDFLKYSELAPHIESITASEKIFLEELFYFDAREYGFYGKKVFHNLTHNLKKKNMYKVPYSGHFLRIGPSLDLFQQCQKDIGESLILTSGIRGMAKQFHLFILKAIETGGNISKASRSLAPPGYSFHGLGDFDVGKIGHGIKNFTDDFSKTDEYKKLIDLGYVNIRYTQSNDLGVRFEPWHVKVS